jgi:hypothetical protein
VTIRALHLDTLTQRTEEIRLKMFLMIQFDLCRVRPLVPDRLEFGMIRSKVMDAAYVTVFRS